MFFPSFAGLPHDMGIDSLLDPRLQQRHWCFLGEIVGDASFVPVRLTVHVKDIDGHQFELAFYTDERGAEVGPALGYTAAGSAVAILYAEWHNFAFSPPGIRHEYPRRFKASHPRVLPVILFLVFLLSFCVCFVSFGSLPGLTKGVS
jgi:hypothetical protein